MACEEGLPGEQGAFLAAYDRTRAETTTLAIDHSTVATALLSWMSTWTEATWEGSASQLLTVLSEQVHGVVLSGNSFPKAPNRLSGELRRITPALRRVGVKVELSRTKFGSRIRIERTSPPAEPTTDAASSDGKPTLSVITDGCIPFDRPYEVHVSSSGLRSVIFDRLTEAEEAQLDRNTGSLLAVRKDGRNCFTLPRRTALSA
jgi:hypothetical protein